MLNVFLPALIGIFVATIVLASVKTQIFFGIFALVTIVTFMFLSDDDF